MNTVRGSICLEGNTGYGVTDLKEAVGEITKLPLYVANFHGYVDRSSGKFRFPDPYRMYKADLERYYHTKAENNFVFVEEGFVFDLGSEMEQVVEIPGGNMAAAEARVQLYY